MDKEKQVRCFGLKKWRCGCRQRGSRTRSKSFPRTERKAEVLPGEMKGWKDCQAHRRYRTQKCEVVERRTVVESRWSRRKEKQPENEIPRANIWAEIKLARTPSSELGNVTRCCLIYLSILPKSYVATGLPNHTLLVAFLQASVHLVYHLVLVSLSPCSPREQIVHSFSLITSLNFL